MYFSTKQCEHILLNLSYTGFSIDLFILYTMSQGKVSQIFCFGSRFDSMRLGK